MKVKINDNVFKVKVLLDKKSQALGMMGKTFDKGFDGLLFLMENKKNSFWMRNCIIPLDIVYITKNKINKIHHNCPPCEQNDCESYNGIGNIILEIAGGSCKKMGINTGDSVEYLF